MKSNWKKIVAITLSICFVFTACFQLIIAIKGNGNFSGSSMSIGAVSTRYSTFDKSYKDRNFTLSNSGKVLASVDKNVRENTILSYSTKLFDNDSSLVKVEVVEKIDSNGNMVDVIIVNGVIYGEIAYNSDGYIESNSLNYNKVYYQYNQNNIIDFLVNGIEYDYEYLDGKLSTVNLDGEKYASFGYSQYGKINQENYLFYSKLFEHSNYATIENAYDAVSSTKIIAKLYDYVNDNPYTIIKSNVVIDGNTYEVVSNILCDNDYIEFTYDYVYNNVPYITKVKTTTEEYELTYINDKILTKIKDGEITTFVYSSTGEVVGMIVGKVVDEEFVNMFVTFVTDGFGNVVEANYLDVKNDNGKITLGLKKIYDQAFDCIGHTVFRNVSQNNINTFFGFSGAFDFDKFGLIYKNGNIYSSLIADYVYQPSEDNITRRSFETNNLTKTNPTLNTAQKSVAIESLQNEIFEQLESSSVSSIDLICNEFNIGFADVFTLPVKVDKNNMLKSPSKVAFIANLENLTELNYYTNLIETYYTTDATIYAMMDDYYLTSLLEEELSYQFIYGGKLFTVKYVSRGLYGYTIKDNFSKLDYLPEKNIINYDTGRYVTYYNSNINKNDYIENIAFITNFSSRSDLDNFFDNLGMINSTIGQTYNDINFGDNTEFYQRLLSNTYNLNLPDYDKEKQYLTIDDNGNYVIENLPEGSGIEADPKNVNVKQIVAGLVKIVQGVMFIVNGVFFMGACGPIAFICGVVTLASGITLAVCGVAQVSQGATGGSWILDSLFNGDEKLLETVASISSTVGSVATIIGSMTYKQCFVEGTKVCTQNGYVSIEDVKPNDYVLSYDEVTGQQSYKRVLETYENTTDYLCEVTVGGQIIKSTLSHPYFVNGEWVEAFNLEVGDEVLKSDGTTAKVESVKIIDSPNTKVYNMNVDENHTYYAEDVLVHNSCEEFTTKETDDLYKSDGFQKTMEQMKKKYPNVNFDNKKDAGKFWNKHRNEFNKLLAKNIQQSPLRGKIVNYSKMLEKGVNPKMYVTINGRETLVNIQYHHFYGKLDGNMFNIFPMAKQQHMLFHNLYGRNDPNNWGVLARYVESLLGGWKWTKKCIWKR